jgi:hypothetical protein
MADALLSQWFSAAARSKEDRTMADDRIRRNQDDLDVDETISENEGGVAEAPDALVDEEDLDDEDE